MSFFLLASLFAASIGFALTGMDGDEEIDSAAGGEDVDGTDDSSLCDEPHSSSSWVSALAGPDAGGNAVDQSNAPTPSSLEGTDQNDFIETFGGSAIQAGDGDDIIHFRGDSGLPEEELLKGENIFTGGEGADLYMFDPLNNSDGHSQMVEITDFNPDEDRLAIAETRNYDNNDDPYGLSGLLISEDPEGQFTDVTTTSETSGGETVEYVIRLQGVTDFDAESILIGELSDTTSEADSAQFSGRSLVFSDEESICLTGESVLVGTDGDDVVHAEDATGGHVTLGDGNDTFKGGNMFVYGGAGDDQIEISDGQGWQDAHGGTGDDQITQTGDLDNKVGLRGDEGDDILSGGANSFYFGGEGQDQINIKLTDIDHIMPYDQDNIRLGDGNHARVFEADDDKVNIEIADDIGGELILKEFDNSVGPDLGGETPPSEVHVQLKLDSGETYLVAVIQFGEVEAPSPIPTPDQYLTSNLPVSVAG